jgi:hypothetical protein
MVHTMPILALQLVLYSLFFRHKSNDLPIFFLSIDKSLKEYYEYFFIKLVLQLITI